MSRCRSSSRRLPARLAFAAAFLRTAYAAIISRGIRSCPMLKWSSERCVCAPHSTSLGTSTSPRLSVSVRTPPRAIGTFLLTGYNLLPPSLASERESGLDVDDKSLPPHDRCPRYADRKEHHQKDRAEDRSE